MNANVSKRPSGTDWERIDGMSDADIDTSDSPPLDEAFFANAQMRLPQHKTPIPIHLDPDVLTWFRGLGQEYQTHINAVLRMYMETQQRHPTRGKVDYNSAGHRPGLRHGG
ncbi:MAG TPA: BrnA antitoxin family protein [Thermoflexia bacterium]|nr:BrnA antitoxin family protein [Thermoflexia bacterium]